MKLISGIIDSGFFAQSALSAEVATKDSLGRNISETYLTGVDLTPYQTTAGMTAYQSAGDYYSASNPSGFITGVPDTYLQNTDLTITDNKVTEISGIPLAGGGSVPEGVMVASGLEFNAVNEISGYSGSAFAGGVPAETSGLWQTASETVTANSGVWGGSALPVSAGKGVKISLQDDTLVFENDETVLYESTGDSANINLSEPLSAFEKIEVSYYPQELANHTAFIEYFPGIDTMFGLAKWVYLGSPANNPYVFYNTRYVLSDNSLTFDKADHMWFTTAFVKAGNGNNPLMISKIVGVNRIAGE